MDIKRQRQQFTKCTLYKQPTINKRHSINNLPLLANAVDASITFQESQFNHIIRIWLQGLLQNHLSVWLPFTWDKILVHFTAGTAMMLGGGGLRGVDALISHNLNLCTMYNVWFSQYSHPNYASSCIIQNWKVNTLYWWGVRVQSHLIRSKIK